MLIISGAIIVLVFFLLLMFLWFVFWLTQKEAKRWQHYFIRPVFELSVSYLREYCVPLNAAIVKISDSLAQYASSPSEENASVAFYHYSSYLCRLWLLTTSGMPIPFGNEDHRRFFEAQKKITLMIPGFSVAQQRDCALAVGVLSRETLLEPTVEQMRSVLTGRVMELEAFRRVLSGDPEKARQFREAFSELGEVLSGEIATLLALPQNVSLVHVLGKTLRGLRLEIRGLREQYRRSEEVQVEADISNFRAALAMMASVIGLGYLLVFGVLAWYLAKLNGLRPLDVVLLAEIAPRLEEAFRANLIPRLSGPEARPTVYALGASVGAMLLGGSFVLIADTMRIGLLLRGLYLALAVTTGLGYLTGTLPLDSVTSRLFLFKCAYVLALFAILSSLPDLVGAMGLRRLKYERFCSGLYGIMAGWILTKGFGPAASIFNSLLFFVAWFIVMACLEALYQRDPRFFAAASLRPMNLIEFSRRVWSERREVFMFAGLLAGCTLVFHALIVIVYHRLLAGRF